MKKVWVIIAVIVVIAIVGYVGRHKLKAMFGGSSQQMSQTAPTMQHTAPTHAMAVAPSDNIYLVKTDPTKGKYLTDFQGMALYIYDKDTTGKSNCDGGCAKAWPPYTSGAVNQGTFPASVTVITRSDGSKQFAWKGMPLYYYASDTKAGDITGEGIGGVWHLVKP